MSIVNIQDLGLKCSAKKDLKLPLNFYIGLSFLIGLSFWIDLSFLDSVSFALISLLLWLELLEKFVLVVETYFNVQL